MRIISVGPDFIKTPLLASSLDKQAQEYLSSLHAVGRMDTPQEIAA